MFSTKLSRAAHRATSSPTAAAITTCSTACAGRPAHQRRPSSSKASCPPDNNAAKAAPAAKADGAETSEAPVSGRREQKSSSKGRARGGYRRVGQSSSDKQVAAEPVDQFAGLPSVPSTQGLDTKGMISLSSASMWKEG